MKSKLRLGLTQRVTIDPFTGERSDCLDQQWTRLLSGWGYLPVPLPNLADDLPAFASGLVLDGLILTGGNDLMAVGNSENSAQERDKCEAELIAWAADEYVPVLGVCRGLQMLAYHYGSEITAVEGHVACNHRIVAVEGGPLPLLGEAFVNSFHRFGIRMNDLGCGLTAAALADDGTVEALHHLQLPQWGILWHPERGQPCERDRVILDQLFRRRDL